VGSHCSLLLLLIVLAVSPVAADTILLGDISYQPDTPITGLVSIFLDNFTDLADLGCSTTFPACDGIDISGSLTVTYQDSGGNTQSSSISVPSTGPGSSPIYEFDPTQLTFDSAVLTGTIAPASFPVVDGKTFNSTGSFTSDILTTDNGFATISATGNEAGAIPEPTHDSLVVVVVMTLGAFLLRRLSAW
jgi:hypothetical protein